MIRHRRARLAAALLFAAAASGACGGGAPRESPEPAPAEEPKAPLPAEEPEAPPPAVEPGAEEPADPGWTAGIVDRTRTVTYPPAVLEAVRTGRHEGFERIVFVFAEDLPGYHLEYVDRPVRQCGSGKALWLEGDGWLEVRMAPAAAHDEEGRPTVADRSRRPGLPLLRDLRLTCDFEGTVTWVAGVSSPEPFRVMELSEPPRLVVDLRTPARSR